MQRNQKSKVEPGYLMIAKIAEEKKSSDLYFHCIFQKLTFAIMKDWFFFLGIYFSDFQEVVCYWKFWGIFLRIVKKKKESKMPKY